MVLKESQFNSILFLMANFTTITITLKDIIRRVKSLRNIYILIKFYGKVLNSVEFNTKKHTSYKTKQFKNFLYVDLFLWLVAYFIMLSSIKQKQLKVKIILCLKANFNMLNTIVKWTNNINNDVLKS